MANNLPKVLVISSVDPYVGPGIVGLEHYNSLKEGGLEVDFLTKYPVEGHPEFISVFNQKPVYKIEKLNEKIKSLSLRKVRNLLCHNPLIHQVPGHFFFYKKEIDPQVPVKLVVSKITKRYDVVYVMFWQGLLSFATIDALYDKLHCQFHFRCVDYSPMSGGCHFTGDCQRYQTGCGMCPGIRSDREDDFTHWNVEYRRKVYEKVKPIVYGNTYMNSFYHKSFLLKDYDRCEIILPLMDNNEFKPLDMALCRQKHNIPSDKEFLIFIASQDLNDERKGVFYLLQALKSLHNQLSEEEREKILLVLAGRNIEPLQDSLCFDYLYLGYVKQTVLPEIYSMSDVYLSPSVNDAGPSMVNQSMSCGTPIVAFEMGTALDVVKGRNTGYCAKLRDSEDFARGISAIFHLPKQEYEALRKNCRDVAEELTSQESHVRNFLRIYEKYK